MDKNNSPIAYTAHILSLANDEIKDALEDLPSVQLFVSAGLERLINRLAVMTGGQQVKSVAVEHPPITEFMGEPISYGRTIEKADLSPDDADLEAFREKVDQMYAQFNTIAPEGLVHSASIPEDLLVIRGVAKKAGIEDYNDREVDIEFIEDIQSAITAQQADAAQQKKIEDELNVLNETNAAQQKNHKGHKPNAGKS